MKINFKLDRKAEDLHNVLVNGMQHFEHQCDPAMWLGTAPRDAMYHFHRQFVALHDHAVPGLVLALAVNLAKALALLLDLKQK